jgi:hypothetical protein
MQHREQLSSTEQGFMKTLETWSGFLTERQYAWLIMIAARFGARNGRAQ